MGEKHSRPQQGVFQSRAGLYILRQSEKPCIEIRPPISGVPIKQKFMQLNILHFMNMYMYDTTSFTSDKCKEQ